MTLLPSVVRTLNFLHCRGESQWKVAKVEILPELGTDAMQMKG